MNEALPHTDERCTLELLQLALRHRRHAGPTGRRSRFADHFLNQQVVEPGILRIQPHPLLAVERFARVHIAAPEVGMQVATEIRPPMLIHGTHEITQGLRGIHGAMLPTEVRRGTLDDRQVIRIRLAFVADERSMDETGFSEDIHP